MRFTLHTSDGCGFVVKDRGKVFARGVLAHQIKRAIDNRVSGDEWRNSLAHMAATWNLCGHHHNDRGEIVDDWDKWAEIRRTSWNDRGRAMVNAIKRGAWKPLIALYGRSRNLRSKHKTWDDACKYLSKNYKTAWSRQDEWSKWATNTASNQRKRMRAKDEKREQCKGIAT